MTAVTVTVAVTRVSTAVTAVICGLFHGPRGGRGVAPGPAMNISRLALSTVTVLLLSGCVSESDPNRNGAEDQPPAADPDALPYAPLGSAKAKQIVAGAAHTCALVDDGTVRCWGYSSGYGEMGSGERSRTDAFRSRSRWQASRT